MPSGLSSGDAKRVTDPVHGNIGLSKVEVCVIDTPAFQRLRTVKQLGLAHLVFPGADFSRFAHSIGVCHVTGQIIQSLNARGLNLPDREVQIYRLAGLLHDVGHYPFSHAMEDAIANHYSSQLLADQDSAEEGAKKFLKHEPLGEAILSADPELSEALTTFGYEPQEVSSVFLREVPTKLANLVSSDLDADRVDYLLRTAHHTGLPYGSIDLPYILSQIALDNEDRICLRPQAMRAAEHFLLSRYFDYQQVAFHKTVAALEWILQDVLLGMLGDNVIDCSAEAIMEMLGNQTWNNFDDNTIVQLIKSYADSTSSPESRVKALGIVRRNPPKLLWENEYLGLRDVSGIAHLRTLKQVLRDNLAIWSEKFNLDITMWHIWEQPGMTLTKIGSRVPVQSAMQISDAETDRYEQSVRILTGDGSTSVDMMSIDKSIIKILSDQALYSLRLYAMIPEDRLGEIEALRTTVKTKMAQY